MASTGMQQQKPVTLAERLFVALDVPNASQAVELAEQLAPLGVSFKVGMQLFYAEGIPVVKTLQTYGRPVFVDLKLHDIPNTVAESVRSLVRHGVTFLNVHAQGGAEMMRLAAKAAQEAAHELGQPMPQILGVTLLTSLGETQLREHLFVESASVSEYVEHLARQAHRAGLQGVVCSAQEASALRKACGPDFLLVTPGIRPQGSETQDQARIVTAAQALQNGADYLVVGRPITTAGNPAAAARQILAEMGG